MESISNDLLHEIRLKHENLTNAQINNITLEASDGLRLRLRALLVALLGISMSACAIASQPVELELEDDEVAQRLNNVSFARRRTASEAERRSGGQHIAMWTDDSVSFAGNIWKHLARIRLSEVYGKPVFNSEHILAEMVMKLWANSNEREGYLRPTWRVNNVSFIRRITKPTIRLVMGYGKLSAFVTAATSLLLLVAVMSKQSWWRRGARWLAAPALLVAALEATSDASDVMIAAALSGSSEPGKVLVQTVAATMLVTTEILVWYFIAKFFEYNPPIPQEDREKQNMMQTTPQCEIQPPPQ